MPTNKPQQSFFIMTHIVWELQRLLGQWNESGMKRQEKRGVNIHLVVDVDLSRLGQVAEEGVKSVEALV